ncbi:L,D-transpeptidase [Amycolatopsis alba]|uniref:Murein L,D-transpeptidase n=1 Tax=Amycolatopsis alba DSM 44262 TaxID=1125972 RepID=A0A229S2M0_AMYAL|nr:L,D-transpeptidase [Amycolatopsis alba]OXM53116.1 murein L,D-transpeptidase [Amycolatopsis alba DSM 44262]
MTRLQTSCGGARPQAAAALLALALVALPLAGCGTPQAEGGGAAAAVAPRSPSPEALAALPEANTFGELNNAPADPSAPASGEVLHPKADAAIYRVPGAEPIARLPETQIGSPTWVPVIARQGEWAQVLLPTRPNGASGWLHATPEAVESAHNDFEVRVDLAGFRLEILEAGKPTGSWKIGTGKPEHPTPTGRAFILASIKESVNTYSPIVLPLSSHSDSHETFGGGPGTVGLHTWPDNSFVGKATSDGCIRVTREALNRLVELPLGTVVHIA